MPAVSSIRWGRRIPRGLAYPHDWEMVWRIVDDGEGLIGDRLVGIFRYPENTIRRASKSARRPSRLVYQTAVGKGCQSSSCSEVSPSTSTSP
jgi:hypothetical protein